MLFTSPTPPRCRYCGKPIHKWTTSRRIAPVWEPGTDHAVKIKTWAGLPRTRDEAQTLFTQQVVSVRYGFHHKGFGDFDPDPDFPRRVVEVGLWDGRSYVDEFFCNTDHAARLGYAMARAGKCTQAYNDAMKGA